MVKLSAVGDVVHTLPALDMLRRLYPHAYITWVIEADASDIIDGHPSLNRVIISHRKRWLAEIKRGKLSAIHEINSFIHELRSCRYDLVIDFHGLLKSSFIVLLAKAKRKLGYDSWQELSGLFLNEKITEDKSKHAVSRYLDFIKYLSRQKSIPPNDTGNVFNINDAETYEDAFTISITDREKVYVEAMLDQNDLNDKNFIAVNPVAFWETKLWEDRKFSQLCDLLARKYNLAVVFTGTEQAPIDRIRSEMSSPSVNLAGKTTLRELACLYRKASLVISTDSGPMHIAAAMGTPVVALFGPTDPKRTGPYGRGHQVIQKNLSCSPCFLKKCTSKECMRLIAVEEVLQAVEQSLMEKVS